MPTAMLTCPHCMQTLKVSTSFQAGSRFRCPGCNSAFAARPQDVPKAASFPESRDDEAPPRSGGWWILAGVIGVAFLLLLGAGVALVLHFLPSKAQQQAVVKPLPGQEGDQPADVPLDFSDKKDPQKNRPTPVDSPPGGPPDLAPPEPPAQAWLPPEQQEKVNDAIDRGVAYLKKMQTGGGTWGFNEQTGLAALPALTLLECGVPADDPHIQNAAGFVRRTAPELNSRTTTYELALAILFLDRLGDPQDESLIHTMALRLLAGQTPAGGWSYNCPVLSEKEATNLWTILETTKPRSSLDLIAAKTGNNRLDDLFMGRTSDASPILPPVGSTIPLQTGPTDDELKQAKLMYDGLSPRLKAMPALKPPTGDDQMPRGDGSDNSNTQFATLGLWAAGRHGVPMTRALSLLGRRFQVSQTPAGGWGYNYAPHPGGGELPAMTGAGLLGLAVGYGVTADLKGADGETPAGEDAQVERGMTALSRFIGPQSQGLYFMWSVERVGMLYNRRTIGDKEWYPWGAAFLLKHQKADGSWHTGVYPGSSPTTDTSFGLLFLKRANLAKDLSSKLQFLTAVRKKDG